MDLEIEVNPTEFKNVTYKTETGTNNTESQNAPEYRLPFPFYDPEEHRKNIDAIIDKRKTKKRLNKEDTQTIFEPGKRPRYGETQIPQEHTDNIRYGLYAHLEFKDKDDKDGYISKENMRIIQDAARKLMRTQRVFVVSPFHREDRTVLGNMKEAIEWIDPAQVHGISTGASEISE